jgi:ankyrin repeat protein
LNAAGATPFLLASQTADMPYMRLLVELGADPLLPNEDGSTPLMAAAGMGSDARREDAGTEAEMLAAVQYLLGLGADINTVDQNGDTMMHAAAYQGSPKMVQLVADSGAKIELWNRKNKQEWTPLLIAQGYRPGNFVPSSDTIEAIERVMRAAGVTPPPAPPIAATNPSDYGAAKAGQ